MASNFTWNFTIKSVPQMPVHTRVLFKKAFGCHFGCDFGCDFFQFNYAPVFSGLPVKIHATALLVQWHPGFQWPLLFQGPKVCGVQGGNQKNLFHYRATDRTTSVLSIYLALPLNYKTLLKRDILDWNKMGSLHNFPPAHTEFCRYLSHSPLLLLLHNYYVVIQISFGKGK